MVPRILVVHNPVAGRRHRARLRQFLSLLQENGYSYDVHLTSCTGDAREAARNIHDIDILFVAGGDGTVNEVINGLAENTSNQPLPIIGFLPLGTANVLRWELGLPRKPKQIIRLLQAGHTLPVRLANANGRRFFLMASVGFDARAVAAVSSKRKRLLGAAAYVLAAFKVLRKAPPCYHVRIDEQKTKAATVIITRAQCYGGPFRIAPNAGLADWGLYVVLLQSYGYKAALRYGWGLLSGRLHKFPDVHITGGRDIEIAGVDGDPIQMDGDVLSMLPLRAGMDEKVIRFLVPTPVSA